MAGRTNVIVVVELFSPILAIQNPAIILDNQTVISIDKRMKTVHDKHRVLLVAKITDLLPFNLVWQILWLGSGEQ